MPCLKACRLLTERKREQGVTEVFNDQRQALRCLKDLTTTKRIHADRKASVAKNYTELYGTRKKMDGII